MPFAPYQFIIQRLDTEDWIVPQRFALARRIEYLMLHWKGIIGRIRTDANSP